MLSLLPTTDRQQWLRPHSIYWKLFVALWLALIISLTVATLIPDIIFSAKEKQQYDIDAEKYSATGLLLYEIAGLPGLQRWLAESHNGSHFWLDNNNNDLLGRSYPASFSSDLHFFLEQGKTPSKSRYKFISLTGYDNSQFVIGFSKLPSRKLTNSLSAQDFGKLILITTLITGILSFFLLRYNIKPLRQLSFTTKKIAQGQFNARTGTLVSQRQDEIGELGRDFDSMAEKLESLINSQQRMLRDISHELRSPLARQLVALELARKLSSEKSKVAHDRIELEAERIDSLISQILAIVRLDTRGIKTMTSRVCMRKLLSAVVENANFEAQQQNKDVQLTVHDGAELIGDRDLLDSAFENFIRNAVKHTAEGSTVEIICNGDYQNMHLVTYIRDHGPGVPEDQLQKIFEPFFRIDEARDRASGGHGLGLAIAARAIKLHDGTITARNAPDGGLEIEARLPCTTIRR